MTFPSQTDLLAGLNDAQRSAMLHGDGPAIVTAGPGSGKTAVLTRRTARLVAEGVDPAHILCITFTNKAAREMRQRIGALVGPQQAKHMAIGTFHAMCARWLRRDIHTIGRGSNFTIYDEADSQAVITGLFKALNLDTKGGRVKAMGERFSHFKNQLWTVEEVERRTNRDDPVQQRVLRVRSL